MRMHERGIGNLPFIAVLVLFIVALALFFMAQDRADTAEADLAKVKKLNSDNGVKLTAARAAYDSVVTVWGVNVKELQRDGDVYPEPRTIDTTLRGWLKKQADEIAKAGEVQLNAKNFTVDTNTNEVKVLPGEPVKIQLYGTPFVQETITARGMLEVMPAQYRYAGALMVQTTNLGEAAVTSKSANATSHKQAIESMRTQYDSDVAAKTSNAENYKSQLDDVRDQLTTASANNDSIQSEMSNTKAESEKTVRTLERNSRALEDRIINIKEKQALAQKEDPKDGEVLVSDPRKGLAYINLGRRNKVSRGTMFTVWRAGKGNRRENVAVIRVITVDRTRSTCKVVKTINSRVPVTAGMNISNPFYDATRTLRVYIYGDLKHYPTEVAKRRLSASGVQVANALDDTVDVIVLGEPPVAATDEGAEDEEAAAVAERKQSMDRERRLTEIMNRALTIGAVVVTEDVLRTFVDY